MKKPYGKLIGASLGPGDPELITRRSWAGMTCGASHGGAMGVQAGSKAWFIVSSFWFGFCCECSNAELFHIKLFDTGLLWTKKRGLSTLFG